MHSPDSATAKERLALWLFHAENSHIPEFEACITAVRNWFEYILNSFDAQYSNGFTEGCNNKTKVLKRVCFGVSSRPLHSFSRVMIDALVCPLATLPKYLGLRPQSSAAFS